ncbi:helix-turn-helix domain-containing protein [Paenibacillus sp. J5C_2022]|uniref:bifunctional transcriptional activator/DNA repair enzyme AdaA n=1 Tax=Paenibacillus sp. J5C2022 TaxID=2977129 RepID=UPI0021D18530|nr:Ada metal-binding domain-containing protein [Paenibacillus sp. J5C2022]MCU6708249.1 helix-turn-helix domain-containing protein [Paenibacillus sp. J5C2022]
MDESIFQSVYETILERDTRYDGVYYTAIRTTGIVCRPSCRSRTPKPENVQLYTSVKEALEAGYRPCKRCRPERPGPHGPDAELVHAADSLMKQQFGGNVTLDSLAGQLQISPYHLQRVYKRTTGATPAKRLQHIRLEEAKRKLAEGKMTIAGVAAATGYRSASHFTRLFHSSVGCTPMDYQKRRKEK